MKKKFKAEKHQLMPKQLKLSDAQKKKVLDEYQITINELPKILVTDAGILSLSAKPGDVIKIMRKSPTAGDAVFYRVVVDV